MLMVMMVIRKGKTSNGGSGTEGGGRGDFKDKRKEIVSQGPQPNQPSPTVWQIMGRQGSTACLSLEGQIKLIIVVMIRVVIRADIRGYLKAKIRTILKLFPELSSELISFRKCQMLNVKCDSFLSVLSPGPVRRGTTASAIVSLHGVTSKLHQQRYEYQDKKYHIISFISINSFSILRSGIFKSSSWGDKSYSILSVAIVKAWRDYHKAMSVSWKATL